MTGVGGRGGACAGVCRVACRHDTAPITKSSSLAVLSHLVRNIWCNVQSIKVQRKTHSVLFVDSTVSAKWQWRLCTTEPEMSNILVCKWQWQFFSCLLVTLRASEQINNAIWHRNDTEGWPWQHAALGIVVFVRSSSGQRLFYQTTHQPRRRVLLSGKYFVYPT